MKLKDWFRARKEKREAKKLEKLAGQAAAEPIPEPMPEPEHEPEPAPEIERNARQETEVEPGPELDRELHEVPLVKPLGVDTSEIVPPDTRFTEEYQEFLKKQEEAVDPITGSRREEK